MYSIIIAIGLNFQTDVDLFCPEFCVLRIESDPDYLFFDIYSDYDLEDGLGITLNNLHPGIYRIQFDIINESSEYKAENVHISTVSWPDCEKL